VNYWFESGAVKDVTINNNRFIDNCTGSKGNTVIMIAPIIKDAEKLNGGYYHRNITISNNYIEAFDHGIIYAMSVDGLNITNNDIIQTHTYAPLYPEKPVINIKSSKNVFIDGNKYTGDAPANIRASINCKDSVVIGSNEGFKTELEVSQNNNGDYDIL
jgi:hypothetical protein